MQTLWKNIFPFLALAMLMPQVSSAFALLTGLIVALAFGNPWIENTKKMTRHLLAFSVVGLGASMDLNVVGRVGASGILYTVVGIGFTLILGHWLGKAFNTARDTALLISVGTAICGGSAIAAVAPTLKAKPHEVSLALITVFLLNTLALLIFPFIGHQLQLTETQFGLWSALAIHDTSSVVGSAMQFGPKALEIATTVKLTRALWIVPVTLLIAFIRKEETTGPMKKPWFIGGFLLMAALMTWVPDLKPVGTEIAFLSRRLLVLTLFLIGSNVPREVLKTVGLRPLVLGLSLWVIVGSLTLACIKWGFIH